MVYSVALKTVPGLYVLYIGLLSIIGDPFLTVLIVADILGEKIIGPSGSGTQTE